MSEACRHTPNKCKCKQKAKQRITNPTELSTDQRYLEGWCGAECPDRMSVKTIKTTTKIMYKQVMPASEMNQTAKTPQLPSQRSRMNSKTSSTNRTATVKCSTQLHEPPRMCPTAQDEEETANKGLLNAPLK